PLTVNIPLARPWVTIAAMLILNLVLNGTALTQGGLAYGGQLARLFSFIALVVSARPALVAAGDFAMRELNSQKAEVFTHWGTILPLHLSAQEFYEKLEAKIRERQWPGVELVRVLYSEA